MQGRLRNEPLEVVISTSCGHCGEAMDLTVDRDLRWRVKQAGADPRIFLPTIDWSTFLAPNIIGDY